MAKRKSLNLRDPVLVEVLGGDGEGNDYEPTARDEGWHFVMHDRGMIEKMRIEARVEADQIFEGVNTVITVRMSSKWQPLLDNQAIRITSGTEQFYVKAAVKRDTRLELYTVSNPVMVSSVEVT